jgi:hypothetical protein
MSQFSVAHVEHLDIDFHDGIHAPSEMPVNQFEPAPGQVD